MRRSRRGQVSAVAVLLGLLLVVTYIANYLGQQLPSQMQEYEFEHTLQVENQLGRLQADVLAQALHPGIPITLSSPVTLGSEALPPFAPASTGAVSFDPNSFSLKVNYTLAKVSAAPPNWGAGNLCSTLTSSSCGNTQSNQCTPPLDYNLSVSNTSFLFDLTGSNNCVRLNMTGSNDTITLGVTGSNLGYFTLALYGSNDVVLLNNHFSGSGFHAWFYLYGSHNTYEALAGPTGSNMFLNTYFVGQRPTGACPAANDSSTDSWSISGSSSSNSIQNLTWYNSVGYSTPYVQTSGWPGAGNSGSGDRLGWQNVSSTINCAFQVVHATAYSTSFVSGVHVHLANRYNPPEDVVYEGGAVILSHPGSGSFMTGPPRITITKSLTGAYTASFSLVNLVAAPGSNAVSEEGTETASVNTHVASVDSFTVASNPNAGFYIEGISLAITTPYPSAWAGYLDNFPSSVLQGGAVSCSTSSLPAGSTCLVPPAGQLSTLTGELEVSQFSFTAITIVTSLA